MLPPTPFSLLCAILLCLPLAVIFTFTAPTSTVSSSSDAAATSPLPLPLPITSTNYTTKTTLATDSLSPRKTLATKNLTLTAAAAPPPPPPLPPPSPEDEAEDQSLLKLASRTDPNPRPTKKLALMFLTTGPLPFAPLWERFFSRAATGRYNVYVHADPGAASYGGVFANRSIPSKPTRRHTPTLIAAARRLLAHALLHDSSNAMFALLSPSCVPIHSFNYTYRILMRSRRSFVEILKNEPGAYERWAARGEEAMAPEVGYEDFRIGSQFWVVRRRHAKVIVRDRRLWSKFKLPCLRDDTCYPEEHYFPTLLSMVDPRGCTPCTLTHVDWRGSHGGHPRTYVADEVGPELIRALRKSRPRYGDEEGSDGYNSSVTAVRRRRDPFLFARKFHPGALGRLVDIANDVLFKD